MIDIREVLVELAESYVDVGVSIHPIEYAQLLMGPGDPEASYAYFVDKHTSGCALTCLGLLRKAGLRFPTILEKYKPGFAMDTLVKLGEASGAWIPFFKRAGRLPGHGDMVIVGAPTSQHAYTVVDVRFPGGCLIEIDSVDGGQRDKLGQEIIGRRTRTWNLSHENGVIDRTAGESDGLGNGSSRPLVGWVDVGALDWPDD